jgi:hypothetical protein
MDLRITEWMGTSLPLRPQFIYSCNYGTKQLFRTNLLTGEQSHYQIPSYSFKLNCRLSELPGGSLLSTGGCPPVREVVKIDTLRECAVSSLPPMHTPKYSHAAVYHSQYLYILGGVCYSYLRGCERYVCAESQWEVLPAMPVAGLGMSAVVLDNSLYALGGYAGRKLSAVQKLSLDSLTWELMQLKLPQAARYFPCFKTDTEVYMVIKKTLYSFTPFQVKPIQSLVEDVVCDLSYYSRGTLYYSTQHWIKSLDIGELA